MFRILAISAVVAFLNASTALPSDSLMPHVAKWYQNKTAAISLRFDDSRECHVTTAIPLLNKYGFKATFMINPGLPRYQKYKDFWEQQVPLMGHELGNHTMHHSGAASLEEADYEIGEVSRLIWKLYPNRSPLLVFASGGGQKWGGMDWENASPEYKNLVKKYSLIDLYDGNHPSKAAGSNDTAQSLCDFASSALKTGAYRAIHFHTIGRPDWKDRLTSWYEGESLAVDRDVFEKFLACLNDNREAIWVAPVLDISEYQEEYKSAKLIRDKNDSHALVYGLKVSTDPHLYDHSLTLEIPLQGAGLTARVFQDHEELRPYNQTTNSFLVDIRPIDSTIRILVK